MPLHWRFRILSDICHHHCFNLSHHYRTGPKQLTPSLQPPSSLKRHFSLFLVNYTPLGDIQTDACVNNVRLYIILAWVYITAIYSLWTACIHFLLFHCTSAVWVVECSGPVSQYFLGLVLKSSMQKKLFFLSLEPFLSAISKVSKSLSLAKVCVNRKENK